MYQEFTNRAQQQKMSSFKAPQLYPSEKDFEQFLAHLESEVPAKYVTEYLSIQDEQLKKKFVGLKDNLAYANVFDCLRLLFVEPKQVTLENISWLLNKSVDSEFTMHVSVGFLAFYLEVEEEIEWINLLANVRDTVETLAEYVKNILCPLYNGNFGDYQDYVVELLDGPYISRFGVEKEFQKKIIECFQCEPGSVHAPYFTLTQRSGSGKTKMLVHTGNEFIFMVYILLEERQYGTPRHIIKWITSLRHSDFSVSDLKLPENKKMQDGVLHKATQLLYSLAQYLLEFIQAGCYQKDRPHNEHDSRCYQKFLDLFKQNKNVRLSFLSWRRIEKIMETSDFSNYNPFAELEKLDVKFVIALDEVRHLIYGYDGKVVHGKKQVGEISPFQVIQKALANIFPNTKKSVCMIMADRDPIITESFPRKTINPDYKISPEAKFLEPFYILSGQDIKASDYLRKALSSTSNWHEFLLWRDENPHIFATLGSPLWSVKLIPYWSKLTQVDNAISFAGSKLCKGNFSITDDRGRLAFLAAKCQIQIPPHSEFPKKMAAENMALLQYLTPDKQLAYVGYPSDPILAAGATRMIRWTSESSKPHPIEVLKDQINKSIVRVSNTAEVVGQIYLMAAFESLKNEKMESGTCGGNKKEFLGSRTVARFLAALLGPENFEILKEEFADDESKILEGRLFFNHTIQLTEAANIENLQNAFIRGAILCGSQEDWNICIPVALPDGTMSALFFQTRNYPNPLNYDQMYSLNRCSRYSAAHILNPDSEEKYDGRSLHFLVNFVQGNTNFGTSFDACLNSRFLFIEGAASKIVHHAWCSERNSVSQYPEEQELARVRKALDHILLGQLRSLLASDPCRADFYESDHGFWNNEIDLPK